jgi:hypothetical protein
VFQAKDVEKTKTHVLFAVTFFQKSCRVVRCLEKYATAGQATDDNKVQTLCILDT